MGIAASSFCRRAQQQSDDISDEMSEDMQVSLDQMKFDQMSHNDILALIKGQKYPNILIPESFGETCGEIELENKKIIPIILELYQKLFELFGEYKPLDKKKMSAQQRMMFFLKPKFSMETLEEFLNIPVEKDQIPFEELSVDIPDITHMESDLITLSEFDDAFGKKISKKDMIGISKLLLKSLPVYLKRRILTAMNRHFFNPDIAADTPSLVRVSYLYKVAKKGPLDQISSFRQIVSVNNTINHFHRILAIRLSNYMINNGLLDINIQKGGIKGIKSAIVEQVVKIKSVLKEANNCSKPCVMLFLDISNAFGNVSLDALFKVLEFYQVDNKIIDYIRAFYSTLTYHVNMNGQCSSDIKWSDGLIQGCALSPILFVTILNYVLVCLDQEFKETHGYEFENGMKILFTAFVDDICIICNSVDHAQEVLDRFNELAQMIGLPLNKEKSAVMFVNTDLDDQTVTARSVSVESLESVEVFKYLGEYVSADGTSSYSYNQLLCWTLRRLKGLNKKKYSLQKKADIFNEYILPHIQKKTALMYDIERSQRYQLLFIVKKYALKWIRLEEDLPVFLDIQPMLEKSTDSIINNLPPDLFDLDLGQDLDLSTYIFKNDSFRLKYNDDDEIIIDEEIENLTELVQ